MDRPFYGSINQDGLWWDGKTWRKEGKHDVFMAYEFGNQVDEKNCHPDGDLVCPRCRNFHFLRDTFDNLCDGCVGVILKNFPDHESVPYIKAAIEKERLKYG
jgi:hypothetical protein